MSNIAACGTPIEFCGHQDGEIAVAVATSDSINSPFHDGLVLITTALGSLANASDMADPRKGENLCYVAALPVTQAIEFAGRVLGALSSAIDSGGGRAAIRQRLLAEIVPEELRAELRDALAAPPPAEHPSPELCWTGECADCARDRVTVYRLIGSPEFRAGTHWIEFRDHNKRRTFLRSRPTGFDLVYPASIAGEVADTDPARFFERWRVAFDELGSIGKLIAVADAEAEVWPKWVAAGRPLASAAEVVVVESGVAIAPTASIGEE